MLPGALYSVFGEPASSIEKLPLAQVPEQIRQADPNLQFAPLVRLVWKDYALLIGDGSIAVSCNLPYPGWLNFRAAIFKVVDAVSRIGIANSINRYSVKYVDLVPEPSVERQVRGLNWNIRVGKHELAAEIASVRVEIPRGDYLHLVSIQTAGLVNLPGARQVEGVIVDVDTICNVSAVTLAEFMIDMNNRLDLIHAENKVMFFECITQETLQALEPSYE